MAWATTSQTLIDGARNVIIKVTGISDGTDMTLLPITDVASMTPPAGTSLKVWRISYSVGQQGLVQLQWEAATPQTFAVMQGVDHVYDYERFGGLWNDGGAGATGNILLSTQNFTVGSSYDLTIEMIKGV